MSVEGQCHRWCLHLQLGWDDSELCVWEMKKYNFLFFADTSPLAQNNIFDTYMTSNQFFFKTYVEYGAHAFQLKKCKYVSPFFKLWNDGYIIWHLQEL